MEEQLHITITNDTAVVLSLDDAAMRSELGVELARYSANKVDIRGSLESVRCVVDDLYDRANTNDWDQPRSWKMRCRRAWKAVVPQINAQGYNVSVNALGSVRITRATLQEAATFGLGLRS